ncbi:MAG: hypothetical protein H0X17_07905 [Deltaproteobacteria bacterium]|nr:hypothetical protein [Deltaproteobacteria bacterium]
MSVGGVVAMIATAVPLTFGATRKLHDRWRARWQLRHHRELDASAREGDLVQVTGYVRGLDETLVAPLSGRACVAYRSRVRITLRQHKDDRGGSGETMQIRPFVIDRAGADPVVVDSEHVMFGLPPVRLVPRNPEREDSFLARHAIDGTARFSEVALLVGMQVRIGGTLMFVPRERPAPGELGFRDPPPPVPQLTASRHAPLLIATGD